jgi:hypothetical protein
MAAIPRTVVGSPVSDNRNSRKLRGAMKCGYTSTPPQPRILSSYPLSLNGRNPKGKPAAKSWEKKKLGKEEEHAGHEGCQSTQPYGIFE